MNKKEAPKNEAPVLLTVREVSILLRVQRPKVYDLIKDGAIEGFKVGADWRIRRDSVETLIGQIPENFFDKMRDDDGEDMGADEEFQKENRAA